MTPQQLVPQADSKPKYIDQVSNVNFGSWSALDQPRYLKLGLELFKTPRQPRGATTRTAVKQPAVDLHVSAMKAWRALRDSSQVARQVTEDDTPRSIQTPRSSDKEGNVVEPLLRNRSERRRWIALKLPRLERVTVLSKWQGRVREVKEELVCVDLFDLINTDIVETAEFEWGEISDRDRELVRPGAEFYWYVLCHDHPNGDRTHESRIWFRRSGRMTKEEFVESLRRADDVWESFGWKGSSGNTTSK